MSSTNIDYVSTYFEFRTLTKIHGEPTYESLKSMTNELKANACSVTSDLGGGAHGHLGLVMTPMEYVLVSTVVYVRPAHPGALAIYTGTLQHEAKRLQKEHRENIRLFRESTDVEKSLIKQLVATIEAKYIENLRDANSNSIMIPM